MFLSEWCEFPSALCLTGKKNLMTACVSMLLKSPASLTCFQARFLHGRAKDLSAPWYKINNLHSCIVIAIYFMHVRNIEIGNLLRCFEESCCQHFLLLSGKSFAFSEFYLGTVACFVSSVSCARKNKNIEPREQEHLSFVCYAVY